MSGRSDGQLHIPTMQTLPPVHAMPHAPQFVLLLHRSVQSPLQSCECGSVRPSQSSSSPLQPTSCALRMSHAQMFPRPGTPEHDQLLPDGQS